MPTETTPGLRGLLGSCTDLWIGAWRCAAGLGVANLRGLVLFQDPRPRRDEALAGLGRTLERFMRSRVFLATLPSTLRIMNGFVGRAPVPWAHSLLANPLVRRK
jgi:hypothetical protein